MAKEVKEDAVKEEVKPEVVEKTPLEQEAEKKLAVLKKKVEEPDKAALEVLVQKAEQAALLQKRAKADYDAASGVVPEEVPLVLEDGDKAKVYPYQPVVAGDSQELPVDEESSKPKSHKKYDR